MIKNYLKVMQRNILRQPMHIALNLSCLSVGIAGTLLILLYLHFELTYDRYHSNANRIYRVTTNAIKTHEKTIDVDWSSTPALLAPTIKQDYAGIEAYARLYQFWISENVKFRYDENVLEEAEVYAADPTVFDVFSFEFIRGNPKTALQGPDKIVISESLAKRIFGDEDPLGKILKTTLVHQQPDIDPQYSLIITGVYRDMPKNVHLFAEALISSQTDPALEKYYFNQFNVFTYLLLHPKTHPETLTSKLTEIYTKYLDPARDPVLVSASHKLTVITKIHIEATGGFTYIYIFSGVGLLLLLISGISYVNLTTAQASRRALEIGLRKVMGSQQEQLISQFLGESMLLTLMALMIAIGMVVTGIRPLNEMLSLNLSIRQLWEPQLVLSTLAIIVLLGILGGSYPAFFLASIKPVNAMKDKIVRKAPLRKVLVSIQLAVVTFVLVSTGMIDDQLQYLRKKDLGFDKEHIVNLTIPGQYEDPTKYLVFKNTLLQNPSIGATGTSDFTPGTDDMGRRPIAIDGSPDQDQKFVYWGKFDYDFLSTMNIQVLSGRNFSPDFPADTAAVIVNEALVKAFGLKEILGDKVRFGGKGNPKFFVIVGVVKDFHQSSLHAPIEPQMYVLKTSNKVFIKISNGRPAGMKHIEECWGQV
ncbi:MAG TPA: ABC transporter permease, partial [Chryseolinea sp.]|nr:ABC transporter permease [Chryseolinea sp.]